MSDKTKAVLVVLVFIAMTALGMCEYYGTF